MRKLLRALRARWTDWRSDTRVAFGGPLDGQRLPSRVRTVSPYDYPITRYYVHVSGFVCYVEPSFCEGVYELDGRRFKWRQWSRVDVLWDSIEEAP